MNNKFAYGSKNFIKGLMESKVGKMRERKRSISWKILNMPLTAHKLGRILWKHCLKQEEVAILLVVIREVSLGLETSWQPLG